MKIRRLLEKSKKFSEDVNLSGLFKGYSKKEIEFVITSLSESQKKSLNIEYNLDNNLIEIVDLLNKADNIRLIVTMLEQQLLLLRNKTIYDYFKNYSKEEVDNVISKLGPKLGISFS